jgi:hypothetical protein
MSNSAHLLKLTDRLNQLPFVGLGPFDTYSGEMVSENENDTSIFSGRIVYWRTGN